MVVDRRTGVRQIAKDIAAGQMMLHGVSMLFLMIVRADFMNNDDPVWILQCLVQAVSQVRFKGRLVVSGPFPAPYDQVKMCREITEFSDALKHQAASVKNIEFCDLGSTLYDKYGVIPQLLDYDGLTLDGLHELKLLCAQMGF